MKIFTRLYYLSLLDEVVRRGYDTPYDQGEEERRRMQENNEMFRSLMETAVTESGFQKVISLSHSVFTDNANLRRVSVVICGE